MPDVKLVTTVDQLRAAYRDLSGAKHIAYDLETTGLDALTDSILLAQFRRPEGPAWVVQLNRIEPAFYERFLLALTEDTNRVWLAHNAQFEYQFTFTKYGIRLPRLYCSKVAELILTSANPALGADLESTVQRRLGIQVDKTQQKSFIGAEPATFDPTAEQVAYAAEDVFLLHPLRSAQVDKLRSEQLLATAKLEFEVIPAFAEMELAGLLLNVDKHTTLLAKYEADADHYGNVAAATLQPYYEATAERKAAENASTYADYQQLVNEALEMLGGRVRKDTPADKREALKRLRSDRDKYKPKPLGPINLNSDDQVKAALAEAGVVLPNLQAETVLANAERSPVLTAFANYKKAEKIVSTYGASLRARIHPVTGRIHPSANQIVSTGRASMRNPNGQNMPGDIRECFEPAPGHKLVVADFQTMELRIVAGLSGDETMLAAIASGDDLHCITAAKAYPDKFASWRDVPKNSKERKDAKLANFAVIYGSGSIAAEITNGIKTAYPTMWQWLKDRQNEAVVQGYVCTAIGRRRYFQRPTNSATGYQAKREADKQRAAIARQGGNHPVQGTGADITKLAMVYIWKQIVCAGLGQLVNVVHDELVIECADSEAERVAAMVAELMKKAAADIVPNVEIGADVHIMEYWAK